jgi:hypothetical protein
MLKRDVQESIGRLAAIERSRQPAGSRPFQAAAIERSRQHDAEEIAVLKWTDTKPDPESIALLKSAVLSEGSHSARGSMSAPSETRRLSRFSQLQIPTRRASPPVTHRRLGEDAAIAVNTDPASSPATDSAVDSEAAAPPQAQPPQQKPAAAAAADRLTTSIQDAIVLLAAASPTRPGPQALRGFRAPWLREPLLDIVDTGSAVTESTGPRKKPRGVADVLAMVALSLGPTASQSVPTKTRRLRLNSLSSTTVGLPPAAPAPPPTPRSGEASPHDLAVQMAVSPRSLRFPLPPLGSPQQQARFTPPAALHCVLPGAPRSLSPNHALQGGTHEEAPPPMSPPLGPALGPAHGGGGGAVPGTDCPPMSPLSPACPCPATQ